MPPPQQISALAERVLPIFAEYGVSAFVLVGYVEDGDGKLQRICIAQTAKNPAFEDGLRPILQVAHIWGAAAEQFIPPPKQEGERE